MSNILVLNATGKVSQGVVRGLAAAGHHVIAASRHPKSVTGTPSNVRQVHFSYEEPTTFDAALDGVDRVFWLSPPLVLDGATYTRPFFDRALSRVKKVVTMTAAGVETSDQIPLRQAELLVERSGVAFVHLRPTWFSDNFHTFWLGMINGTGTIALPAGDGASAFIDARDIAASAVAALTRDDIRNQAFTLTGPASHTYADAASVLARVSGRPDIRYMPISDHAFIEGAVQMGLSAQYAGMLATLFDVVRQGWAPPPTTDVRTLTGAEPITFEAYAQHYVSAWRR
ncbi:MAG: NAD(P)H-binding protein [Kofleriaceae bacterium]|nr:NAD(P)H-binding protein [Kofleriaceae bacterium]